MGQSAGTHGVVARARVAGGAYDTQSQSVISTVWYTRTNSASILAHVESADRPSVTPGTTPRFFLFCREARRLIWS